MKVKNISSTTNHRSVGGGAIPLGFSLGKKKDSSSSSSSSYLMNIKIPSSKTSIRVNIPKLLIPKRFHGGGTTHSHTNNINNNNITTTNHHQTTSFSKSGNLLSTKVGSIFTHVFRSKKKNTTTKNDRDSNTFVSRENSGLLTKKMRSVKLTKKVLLLPSATETVSGRCNRGGANGVVVMAKRDGSGKLVRVSSGVVQSRRKVRLNNNKYEDSEKGRRDSGGVELCKKRILMGGKCKPLNVSGTLQYDNNGVLLPEPLP
ncbi:hypothetical protein CsatA_008365 [Cannabis sativa]